MPVSRGARRKAICDPSRSFLPSVGEGDDADVERRQGVTRRAPALERVRNSPSARGSNGCDGSRSSVGAMPADVYGGPGFHRTLQAQQRDPGEMQFVGLVRTAGRDRQFVCGNEATLRIARTDRVTDRTIIGPVAMACTSLSDTRAAIA